MSEGDEDQLYIDYQRESTMDSSRYSESLNALIGHSNASWSPNSILNCESCNKVFTFTRRRHHCRKCGCLVCYKCSKHELVLPRLSDTPCRVCDSCYHQVNCNPVEDLAINSAEDSLAKEFLSQIVYISVISKNDLLLQAIIQGFSTALSGTPLGMEIDVRKFPPYSWNVRFANTPSVLTTPTIGETNKKHISFTQSVTPENPTQEVIWSQDHENSGKRDYSKHTNSHKVSSSETQESSPDHNTNKVLETNIYSPPKLHLQQSVGDINSENENATTTESDEERSLSSADHCLSPSPVMMPPRLLDLVHYTEFARMRGRKKAKASYEMFISENNVAPDYGVAIEMGFSTINGEVSSNRQASQTPQHTQPKTNKQPHTHCDPDNEPRKQMVSTYSISWKHNYSLREEEEGDDDRGCKQEDCPIFAINDEENKYPKSTTDEIETYYLFYWISVWDGSQMRCGRSSHVMLPPSVCAQLESETMFEKLVRTESTTRPMGHEGNGQIKEDQDAPEDCHHDYDHVPNPTSPQNIPQTYTPTSTHTHTHTHLVHTYREVDPELIIIALLSQQEQDYLLSSCSLRLSLLSHPLRSTLHNLPSPLPTSQAHSEYNEQTTSSSSLEPEHNLPDTTLLTPAAGLIGWLSGGKVNRNKFLEAAIHMTMLPFLFMRTVYETKRILD